MRPSHFLNSICLMLVGACNMWAADLNVNYLQPAMVTIDWDGYDQLDGDGNLVLTGPGDAKTATLSVLCNSINGYQIILNSANAIGVNRANLVKGSDVIGYSVALDTTGVLNATILSSVLVLNNPSTSSVNVNFVNPGNIMPLVGTTQAHPIKLTLTLDVFNGNLVPAGTYLDVITATVVLN